MGSSDAREPLDCLNGSSPVTTGTGAGAMNGICILADVMGGGGGAAASDCCILGRGNSSCGIGCGVLGIAMDTCSAERGGGAAGVSAAEEIAPGLESVRGISF